MSTTDTQIPTFDITYWPRSIDALYAATDDAHERAMLLNMRRHILLELSGRYKEVLAPEYTVEVPEYRVVTPLGAVEPKGLEEVEAFYEGLFGAQSGVWSPIEESPVVAGNRILSEALLAAYMPGEALVQAGADVPPDGWYMATFNQVYVFEFDDDAKLIGERSYDANNMTFYPVADEDVVTFDMAAEALAPYLEHPPS